MYAAFGDFEEAEKIFKQIPRKDAISFNAMMMAYNSNNSAFSSDKNKQAVLKLVAEMEKSKIELDQATFVIVLNTCAAFHDLENGKKMVKKIEKIAKLKEDQYLIEKILNMYCHCNMKEAQIFFDKIQEKNLKMWNLMMHSYNLNKDFKSTMNVFQQMEKSKMEPDSTSFSNALIACGNLKDIKLGSEMYRKIPDEMSDQLSRHLITMYGKCEGVEEAESVFDASPKDEACYQAMIKTYRANNREEEAQKLQKEMGV